jgi:hypothetical protein
VTFQMEVWGVHVCVLVCHWNTWLGTDSLSVLSTLLACQTGPADNESLWQVGIVQVGCTAQADW